MSGISVARRVSVADPVRQSGNRLTIDAARKFQDKHEPSNALLGECKRAIKAKPNRSNL